MIVLGIILIIVGIIIALPVLTWIGVVLLVIGLILALLGATGRAVAGRKYWF